MTTPAIDRLDAATAVTWTRGSRPPLVLDVRTPGEFDGAHIAGSVNVPLDLLTRNATALAANLPTTGAPVVVVCQTGPRAEQAARKLLEQGLPTVHVVTGGVPAVAAAGGDVVRGKERWAMDRQVRLVAGSIVLTSIAASVVAPKARFLAGAIGGALTVTSLADICPMAIALGKLPYNRGAKEPVLEEILQRVQDASS